MATLQRPIVVIFGAGASRGGLDKGSGVPPPVDRDFFDIANQLTGHGTPKLAKRVLNDVWQLYEVASSSGIDGVFFKIPVIRGAISWRTIDIWVYHRQQGKETSGGYFRGESLEISDPSFARLRIHFVHLPVGDLGSFDLDVVFSPNEHH